MSETFLPYLLQIFFFYRIELITLVLLEHALLFSHFKAKK